MRHFIFLDNRDFEQGSLEEHLRYLRNYDGTPDFWDSKDDLLEALQTAKDQIKHSVCRAVITDEYYKVIEEYEPNHYQAIRKTVLENLPETHSIRSSYYDEGAGFELNIERSKESRHGGLLLAGEGTEVITNLDIVNYRTVWSGENKTLKEYQEAIKEAMKQELY